MGGEIGSRKNIDVAIADSSEKQRHVTAPGTDSYIKLIKAFIET